MTYVFCSDWHLDSRLGEYRLDCLGDVAAKMEFIVATAGHVGADAILFGGDWVNRPTVGYTVQSVLLDIVSTWPRWIGVLGQHDFKRHDLSTYTECAVGPLRFLEGVTLLERGHPIQEPCGAVIGGFPYADDMAAAFDEPNQTGLLDIAIVHYSILPDVGGDHPFALAFRHIAKPAKRMLLGDYHAGYGFKTLDIAAEFPLYGCPGAMTRVSPSESKYRPKALLLQEKAVGLIAIPHRPAEEVFDLERYLSDRAAADRAAQRADRFANALRELGEIEEHGIKELVARLAAERAPEVAARALELLSQATEGASD